MSEYINNTEQRIDELYDFAKQIINGGKGIDLVKKYEEAIDNVQPFDVIVIVDRLVKDQIDLTDLKLGINKVLNMFYRGLINQTIPDYTKVPFLASLWHENNELNTRLINLRPLIKKLNSKNNSDTEFQNILKDIGSKVTELNDFEVHYIKKENILFPYVEKQLTEYQCQSVMWSYHDDIRHNIKDINKLTKEQSPDMKLLNRKIGDLFFAMYTIRFREEYILFPVITKLIMDKEWISMQHQSYEVGFAFISPPEKLERNKISDNKFDQASKILNSNDFTDSLVDLETGQLSIEQIIMMINNLPVDVTFVDENDEVRYFSTPSHRIFPRSKAIIGRLVENCHPPSSVHIVKELMDKFKSGEKDQESFWIEMGDKFLLIRYYALRDKNGNYKGTLEVSEDVSTIRKLTGEKRLME
ncbi:MAG: PAS domain-containing protein [Bacteroidota bacterium]